MAKSYTFRRGMAGLTALAAASGLSAGCAQGPEREVVAPPLVQVEVETGRVVLNGCFEDTRSKAPRGVGTLAIAQATNDEPITIKFTTVGSHEEETVQIRDLSSFHSYTPSGSDWYFSQQGDHEAALCTQRLSHESLPQEYDGLFAQANYYRDDKQYEIAKDYIRSYEYYGPYGETSYIDNSCGPVTEIGDTLFSMSSINTDTQGSGVTLPLIAPDCTPSR